MLEAARRLFGAHPYEAVTTTEIAREAGVAYGLIAHHFGNKRGLYVAVMAEIRTELAETHDAPLDGGSLPDLLRNALRRHVEYVDRRRDGFRTLMRGGLGSDPDIQELIDDLRWDGAKKILQGAGFDGDPSPLLSAAMRSWVVLFDELILSRIESRQISVEDVVEIASSVLLTTLRTTVLREPSLRFSPEFEKLLSGDGGPPTP
ncbi:TetR/AcrR family transcriptional regulator [Cryptosporangium minutisporangium]|uniref:TetR/AcrR family transcriptional regulator n=1 Tax=Cryptosporangium minutisporangium TaxID=113569 RepID=UPI0031E56138